MHNHPQKTVFIYEISTKGKWTPCNLISCLKAILTQFNEEWKNRFFNMLDTFKPILQQLNYRKKNVGIKFYIKEYCIKYEYTCKLLNKLILFVYVQKISKYLKININFWITMKYLLVKNTQWHRRKGRGGVGDCSWRTITSLYPLWDDPHLLRIVWGLNPTSMCNPTPKTK